MATQNIPSKQFSRLACSVPNIAFGEIEDNNNLKLQQLVSYSHVEISSELNESLLNQISNESIVYTTKQNKISNFDQPKLYYFLKLLLATTVILFIGCITGFHLNSLIFPHNIKQYVEEPTIKENNSATGETNKAYNTFGNNQLNTSLQPVEIHVKSYIEYQDNIYAIPDHQPVSVVMELTSPDDWPRQAQFTRAEQVTTLKVLGTFSLNMVSLILSKLQNLVSLTIISNGNALCNSVDMLYPSNSDLGNIRLLRLRYLIFVNLTSCSNILNLIANSPSICGIRQLKLENGVVNKANVDKIRAILYNNRNSLKKLHFPDTRWETPLLTEQFPSLSNLTFLRMDFITFDNKVVSYINTKLAPKFPNLKSFIAIKGFAPWNDFRNILNINTLESLRVGIEIPKDRNEFKLYFLETEFTSLKHVFLSLHFVSSSDSASGCSVHGIDSLRRSFKSLEIQTTCEIHLKGKHNFMSNRSMRLIN